MLRRAQLGLFVAACLGRCGLPPPLLSDRPTHNHQPSYPLQRQHQHQSNPISNAGKYLFHMVYWTKAQIEGTARLRALEAEQEAAAAAKQAQKQKGAGGAQGGGAQGGGAKAAAAGGGAPAVTVTA